MNGHRVNPPNRIVGTTIAGRNRLGIVTRRIVGSKFGPSRSDPSSQPMYQSGWAGELTAYGTNGPYVQIGLIWTSPPTPARIAAIRKNRPVERKTWPGQK